MEELTLNKMSVTFHLVQGYTIVSTSNFRSPVTWVSVKYEYENYSHVMLKLNLRYHLKLFTKVLKIIFSLEISKLWLRKSKKSGWVLGKSDFATPPPPLRPLKVYFRNLPSNQAEYLRIFQKKWQKKKRKLSSQWKEAFWE